MKLKIKNLPDKPVRLPGYYWVRLEDWMPLEIAFYVHYDEYPHFVVTGEKEKYYENKIYYIDKYPVERCHITATKRFFWGMAFSLFALIFSVWVYLLKTKCK
jgi:hypothetical protein